MPGAAAVEIYVEILREFRRGDLVSAFDAYNKLVPFLNVAGLSAERFIHFDKRLLLSRGIIASATVRAPKYVPDEAEARLFDKYCQFLGV